MTRPKETLSETELSHLSGVDRRRVPVLLTEAGLVPVKNTEGRGRRWPRVTALELLRRSDATEIKRLRDAEAADRARILELKMQLKSGRRLSVEEDWYARIDAYIVRTCLFVVRSWPARYCAEIAAVNECRLPELERRAAIRAVFEPGLESIRKLGKEIFYAEEIGTPSASSHGAAPSSSTIESPRGGNG